MLILMAVVFVICLIAQVHRDSHGMNPRKKLHDE